MKRIFAFVVSLVLVAALLSACAKSANPAPGSTPAASGSAGASTPTTEASDGIITIALSSLGATIDPVDNTDGSTSIFIYAAYDRLIRFAVDGDKADDQNYEPSIAKEWKLSDDGLTWTFYLDEKAMFANGDPVEAEDVAFSFQRCAERPNGEFVYNLTRIKETKVVDAHTIEFQLSQPCPTFMQLIEMYPFAIVNKAQVEGQPDEWLATNTAGSGPYSLTSYDTSSEVVMDARDDYWGERAPNNKIIVQLVKEASNRRMLLEKGDIDFAGDLTSQDLDALEANPDVKVESKPSNTMLYFMMNMNMAPFDNVLVRQAMCYAMPYNTLVESVMGGRATQMTSNIPSIMEGQVGNENTGYTQDLEKAKALLKEAGLENGFEFEFILGSGFQDWEDSAVLIQAELAKIGVTMNITKMERAQFLDLMRERDKIQACITRFISFVNDPGYNTGMLLVTDADFNYNGFSNAEFDKLQALTDSTQNHQERMDAFLRMQEIAKDEAGSAYLYEYNNTVVMGSNISGYVFYPDRTIRFYHLTKA